jgi:hypothetical protein
MFHTLLAMTLVSGDFPGSHVIEGRYGMDVFSDGATGNTSRDRYSLLCDVTAHALYGNGPCADTKKTLVHRAATQKCPE